MNTGWDAIVIGSGFGGAVTACRLAEANRRVLVLERGRRWETKDYPRNPDHAWIWSQDRPEKRNGWIDARFWRGMWVAQGAGVGGGSLIYASVFIEAKPECFATGWPAEITYDELKPYYDRAGAMLTVQKLPDTQFTERCKLMRDAAQALGYGDRFGPVELAVRFDPNWHYGLPDPFSDRNSTRWMNDQGREQGTCVHCGNCDIGCQVRAKNTLDLNYIAQAENRGAEVRPLHLAYNISRDGGRYLVHFNRIENGRLVPGCESAESVIVAAGSLGSTELLLRARDQYRTLPDISPFLGRNWSANGDFVTLARYRDRCVSPTQGPTISSAIDLLDGAVGGHQFFVEDGGFPNLPRNYLRSRAKSTKWRHQVIAKCIKRLVSADDWFGGVMPWFGQAVDAADGRLYLGRAWTAPWRRKLKLDWDVARSKPTVDAFVEMHKRLAAATGGKAFVPPTWTWLKLLVTPHALGGCAMGVTPCDGVVNHKGEVFGYPGLYVADGAIIPRAIGLNPSRTIAALAERNSALMVRSL